MTVHLIDQMLASRIGYARLLGVENSMGLRVQGQLGRSRARVVRIPVTHDAVGAISQFHRLAKAVSVFTFPTQNDGLFAFVRCRTECVLRCSTCRRRTVDHHRALAEIRCVTRHQIFRQCNQANATKRRGRSHPTILTRIAGARARARARV